MQTTTREQRGMEIAATTHISKKGGMWIVPSQSSSEKYAVDLTGDSPRCTCVDFVLRRSKCKHIYAVEFTERRETKPDGTTTVTKTVRVTYKQDWHAYNLAQTHEGELFADLLRGLCQGIVQPPQSKGRPRLPLGDVVFAAVGKVYSTKSGRRFMSELREHEANGDVSKVASYNSTYRYLENPALTPILKAMIEEAAAPLKAVEINFAVDASGFSASRFDRWYDAKYGGMHKEQHWLKVHLMCGVKTNVVTSAEVTPSYKHDSPYLPQLVATTAKRFQVAEVSADKAYLSSKNFEAIVAAGAVPYIPFKVNTTGEGPELWRRLYHFYEYNRQEFLAHYHQRSNVETVFSMIKAKFGDAVRSRTDTAQVNEVLCKVLAHNICCLVQSIYELGIEPKFWTEGAGTFEADRRVLGQVAL